MVFRRRFRSGRSFRRRPKSVRPEISQRTFDTVQHVVDLTPESAPAQNVTLMLASGMMFDFGVAGPSGLKGIELYGFRLFSTISCATPVPDVVSYIKFYEAVYLERVTPGDTGTGLSFFANYFLNEVGPSATDAGNEFILPPRTLHRRMSLMQIGVNANAQSVSDNFSTLQSVQWPMVRSKLKATINEDMGLWLGYGFTNPTNISIDVRISVMMILAYRLLW